MPKLGIIGVVTDVDCEDVTVPPVAVGVVTVSL
jgi:hypothetical protein